MGSPTPEWDAFQALLEFAYQTQQRRESAGPRESSPQVMPEVDSELAALAGRVAARAQRVTKAAGANVALMIAGERVVCVGRAGVSASIGARLDPHRGLSGECIRSGRSQLCTDSETDSRVLVEVSRNLGIRSMAMVPLHQAGAVVGVLSVYSHKPGTFGPRDVENLMYLGGKLVENLEQRPPEPRQSPATERSRRI